MPYFSVIVPVYNRRDEVEDLLRSLTQQTDKDFEIILVEDGSTERCEDIALSYADRLDLRYFYKANEAAPSPATTAWSTPRGSISCFLTAIVSSRPTISRRWATSWPTTMCHALAVPMRPATILLTCRRLFPSR